MKMFKQLIYTLPLMMAMQAAQAVPLLSGLVPGAANLADTGGSFVRIIDTDGAVDTITSFVISRSAGYQNAFGFYDPYNTSNFLQLFSGVDGPFAATTINWNGTDFEANGVTRTFSTGGAFGLYVSNSAGQTFYSDASLNADGFDHFLFFNTLGNTPTTPFVNVQNLTFAIEDIQGGGDQDFNDLLASCIDCREIGKPTQFNTPVPVPATMPLFGLGALLMYLSSKKGKGKGKGKGNSKPC